MSRCIRCRGPDSRDRALLQAYRNPALGEKLLHLRDRIRAEVKDRRRQHGIGLAFRQTGVHVLGRAGSPRRNHRHINRCAHRTQQRQIIPGLLPVSIHAVDHNLARAELHTALDPLDRIQAGGTRIAPGMRKHTPARRFIGGAGPAGIDREHDALTAKPPRAFADQIGSEHGGGIDRDFIRPGAQHTIHIINGANSAADRERNKNLRGGALHHIDHNRALVAAGGDVIKDQFIGAGCVICGGQRHGIAGIAMIEERNALDDATGFDIQTRNNTSS